MRATALIFAAGTALLVGCAHTADRKVGYGGEAWSLANVFPEGPNRDLAAAAAAGELSGIDRALKAGADVNFRGAGGLTPLWWATWDQNLAGFTRLLERGANANASPEANALESRSYQPEPVMVLTAQAFWKPAFLKTALRLGGDANYEFRGRTPLGAAVTQGTKEHVDLLVAAGAKLEPSATTFASVMARRYDYVLMFLEKGVDPAARARTGQTLAQMIGMFPYDPNSEQYVWRERVIRFLKSKGIEAKPPSKEGKRTKPLPADLVSGTKE